LDSPQVTVINGPMNYWTLAAIVVAGLEWGNSFAKTGQLCEAFIGRRVG